MTAFPANCYENKQRKKNKVREREREREGWREKINYATKLLK
jgi:hypothetical protein